MRIIKPPTGLKSVRDNAPKVFLAGSIENGAALNWQDKVVNDLDDLNLIFFNPRRAHWIQEPDEAVLEDQIIWELTALEMSDIILMYFDEGTKSPISLLETGLYANSANKKPIIYCPQNFYRFTNVRVTSEFYGGQVLSKYEDWIAETRKRVKYVAKKYEAQ